MIILGIALGILIGVVTAAVFIHLLKVLAGSTSGEFKVVAEVLAIPTFWFGGPWVTTRFLEHVGREEILSIYTFSLTLTFLILIAFPVFRFVITTANIIEAQKDQTTNG